MKETSASVDLEKWLNLGEKYTNPPGVSLALLSQTPDDQINIDQRDVAITSAIQCYSPGRAVMKPRKSEKEITIGRSTLESGHLTTRQHAHYTWRLSGVTRETIHTLLHSFPHYNTDQQSQRYVEANPDSVLKRNDLNPRQTDLHNKGMNHAFEGYKEFLELLRPELRKRITKTLPKKWVENNDEIESKVTKYAQEIARYFLPIGQTSTLFYTLDVMTLMRMFSVGNMPHISDEGRYLLAQMVKSVAIHDESLIDDLFVPQDYEPKDYSWVENRNRKSEFDTQLEPLQNSRLINSKDEIIGMMNTSLGYWKDSNQARVARHELINSANRPNLANNLRPDWHDPDGSILNEINVQFMTKLSHSADSQRQRHRTTNSAVEPIQKHYAGDEDFAIPRVVRENEVLNERYGELMSRQYGLVKQALEEGIDRESALLLIPNAQNIRLIENGSLLGFHHRTIQRLCHLAQEEISYLTWEQASQLNEIFDEFKPFHAPCVIRKNAGVTPYCPEGSRFCGVNVWNQPLEDYWDKRTY